MLYRVILVISFLLGLCTAHGQDVSCEVTFSMESDTIHKDQQQLCVDVYVRDFQNILSIGLPISYPSAVLSFSHHEHPAYDSIRVVAEEDGQLKILWKEPNGVGTQNGLPDGKRLVTLCFDIIDIPSEEFLIRIGSNSGEAGAVVINTEPFIMDACLLDGLILVPCSVAPLYFPRGLLASQILTCARSSTFSDSFPFWFHPMEFEDQLPLRYTIMLDDEVFFDSKINTDDEEGTYFSLLNGAQPTLILSNTEGCIIDTTITVNVKKAKWLLTESTFIQHTCEYANDGKINLRVASGDWPNTIIEWDDGLRGMWHDTIVNRRNLSPGIYTYTVTHSECEVTKSIEILNIPQYKADAQIRQPQCGGYNGSISLIMDPPGQYQYRWKSIGDTTSTITGLGAGTYEVEIIDSLGCNKIERYVVTSSSQMQLSIADRQLIDCATDAWSVAVEAADGLLPNTTYTWSDGTQTTGTTSSHELTAGDHWVIATDDLCRSDTVHFSLESVSSDLSIDTLIVTQPACAEDLGAIEIVMAISSGADLSYYIDDSLVTSSMIDWLPSGSYSISVVDAVGCITSQTAQIITPEAPDIRIDSTRSQLYTCSEGEMVDIFFDHTDGATLLLSDGSTYDGGQFASGEHRIYLMTAAGCMDSVLFVIDQVIIEHTLSDVIPSMQYICEDETVDFAFTQAITGPPQDWRYLWNGTSIPSDSLISLTTGTHQLDIITPEGCEEDYAFEIAQGAFSFSTTYNLTIPEGGRDSVRMMGVDWAAVQSIDWGSSRVTCLDSQCQHMSLDISADTTIIGEIEDTLGCYHPISLQIMVEKEVIVPVDTFEQVSYYVPNAISPTSNVNGDLCVFSDGSITQVSHLRLYDRWGNLLIDDGGPMSGDRFCITSSDIFDRISLGVYTLYLEMITYDGTSRSTYSTLTVVR